MGALPFAPGSAAAVTRETARLDDGWKFFRGDAAGAEQPGFDDASWEAAALPHAARIESLVTGPPGSPGAIWQGFCWYRRTLRVPPSDALETVLLRFDGAMNVAEVWLDGERLGQHLGGYLPFVFDISRRVRRGADQVLAVKLDNRDNAITGPKPQAQLDFNIYHGLYRSVHLVRKSQLHITDPIEADRPASGGVFVTYPQVDARSATVRVQVHIANRSDSRKSCRLRLALRDGRAVPAEAVTEPFELQANSATDVVKELVVASPKLWSPAHPNLYALEVSVWDGRSLADNEVQRIGIRRIAAGPDGLFINGEKTFLRGTNRHQEYPYVGYALSDAAQWRDAKLIKESGFDYVRLSHYAHAPAFMDACDELGLAVMDAIPGWQFFNPDPAFAEVQYRNCRDLVRRDRNHPCVFFWEVSLNESAMPEAFIARCQAIAHEEYPGDQCITAGWARGYDVFLDARQHGGCRSGRDSVCIVSEYGDWEYYAMNAGLDQAAWRDLSPAESNSRQLRRQGERAMLQQAQNFQEAHNDNLATRALADGLWVMFDYNRGYSPDIETSGCMDIFRLPKFSRAFFRSQRDPSEGPMVFIASHWTPASSPDVRVFSNCDEVALHLDGKLLGRRKAVRDRTSSRIPHPPFVFRVTPFREGRLIAAGYVGGRRVAEHGVRTPGPPGRLELVIDDGGVPVDRGQRDLLFVRARILDLRGTVVPDAWENVAFGVSGAASLVGMNPIASEAGVASILVRVEPGRAPAAVYAVALLPDPAGSGLLLRSDAVAVSGGLPSATARRTLAGAELVVQGRVIASLDAGAPKFQVPISAPPNDPREPFRR